MLLLVRIRPMLHRAPFSSSLILCVGCTDALGATCCGIGWLTLAISLELLRGGRGVSVLAFMWVYACHPTTAHAGDAVLVRGE